jgi:hypothetical protein
MCTLHSYSVYSVLHFPQRILLYAALHHFCFSRCNYPQSVRRGGTGTKNNTQHFNKLHSKYGMLTATLYCYTEEMFFPKFINRLLLSNVKTYSYIRSNVTEIKKLILLVKYFLRLKVTKNERTMRNNKIRLPPLHSQGPLSCLRYSVEILT